MVQVNEKFMFDVAIVGAGIAGLTCAQRLHQAGYHVIVVEKSRGLGGRIATRRLLNTQVDHGLRYLEPQSDLLELLIQCLLKHKVLQRWTNQVHTFQQSDKQQKDKQEHNYQLLEAEVCPRYVAPMGMTAIAKFLATDLKVFCSHKVQAIALADQTWQLELESSTNQPIEAVKAQALVVAIPAPQALALLEPLVNSLLPEFLTSLRSVEFEPCISAIAGYSAEKAQDLTYQEISWKAVTFPQDPNLSWLGLDSSKRLTAEQPIFVVQSSATFAKQHLDSKDLQPVGHQLLTHAAQHLLPWLETPEWLQVHRWRYAFPEKPWQNSCLSTSTPLPLVCSGDWCGGIQAESGLNSGLAAATQINLQLSNFSLPDFFNVLTGIERIYCPSDF